MAQLGLEVMFPLKTVLQPAPHEYIYIYMSYVFVSTTVKFSTWKGTVRENVSLAFWAKVLRLKVPPRPPSHSPRQAQAPATCRNSQQFDREKEHGDEDTKNLMQMLQGKRIFSIYKDLTNNNT